jgi:hypothetical protein
MTARLFQQACTALWGPQYQAPAARALAVGRSSVVRYAKGGRDIPPAVLDRLHGLLVKRHGEVGKLIGKLGDVRDGRAVKVAARKEAS